MPVGLPGNSLNKNNAVNGLFALTVTLKGNFTHNGDREKMSRRQKTPFSKGFLFFFFL